MKPLVLCIMDGMGIREEIKGNAFKQASTPNFDFLWQTYPHCLLSASGKEVGLPEGQMGNSEVGHMNIGAGRLVKQPLTIIDDAINDQSFYSNDKFINVMNHVKKNRSKLHILGLISNGGVHSNIQHIIALLRMAKMQQVERVFVHCFTDGRDTLPNVAYSFLKELNDFIIKEGIGKIATISGRYYAMDRNKNWDRIKLAYDAMIFGQGPYNQNIEEIINNSYKQNIYDEFIMPTIVDKEGIIDENDGIIFANFRPDRLIQMGLALTDHSFDKFPIKKFSNVPLISMMSIGQVETEIAAFSIDELKNTFGEYISRLGLKQLRIAETEKYAHVTFFFDGEKEEDLPNMKKMLIPSPNVATYDLRPEMSCNEITDSLLKVIDNFDIIILNYANGDMVGHTGNFNAAIKAVEVVDENLGRLYNKVKQIGGTLLVTADHGNCEEMLDDEGNTLTEHTINPVPFIVTNNNYKLIDGKLGDISPTILKILNIDIPKEMTGNILIKE